MKLLIIILIIIILGLYYAPKETKMVMQATGNAVHEGGKVVYNDLKDSKDIQELRGEIANKVK